MENQTESQNGPNDSVKIFSNAGQNIQHTGADKLKKRHSLTSLRGRLNYTISTDLAQVHRGTSMHLFGGQHFDNASNKSAESIISDVPNSISSTSDLTGYEEEFLQIKKLVSNNNTISATHEIKNKRKNDEIIYKLKIDELESLLQNSREENEKNKFDLNDLETKVQMIWHEKYQDLLRQKTQSELQLGNVKKKLLASAKELEMLRNNNSQSENINLHYKLKQFEVQNVELKSKFNLLHSESERLAAEYKNSELENEQLRISIQELKSDVDSKSTIQLGLKNKITEQHIEVQGHLQANLNLNNQITSLKNELESVKKSEQWYSSQLHSCQLVKSNIQQELMSNKTNLISAVHDLENWKLETKKWKNLYEETHAKAIREKEKYIKKFEVLECQFLERETVLKCTKPSTVEQNNFVTKTDSTETNLIQELQDELENMKNIILDQATTIKNLQVQNTDYIVRLTTLQKNVNETEIRNQTLQDLNKDLEQKSNISSECIRTKDSELLDLKTKIVNLEIGLHGASREKEEIDEVVQSLRHDFNKFMKCYNLMKEKLEDKTRIIAQLEQEKQELFMENNWKICEIEKLQHKVLDRKSLQADLIEMTNAYNEVMVEKENLEHEISKRGNEIQDLKLKNDDLSNNIDNLKSELINLHNSTTESNKQRNENDNIEKETLKSKNRDLRLQNEDLRLEIQDLELKLRKVDANLQVFQQLHQVNEDQINVVKKVSNLENEVLRLSETLRIREEQLENQAKSVELLCNEVDGKDQTIAALQGKCLNSEQTRVEDLSKKLSDANCVIEQFNNLCRNSEIEKNNLSLELKVLKSSKCFVTKEIQTDVLDLSSIKMNLFDWISDNNYANCPDVLLELRKYIENIPNMSSTISEKKLPNKYNQKLESKLNKLTTRCSKLDHNYNILTKVLEHVPKPTLKPSLNSKTIETQTYIEENDLQLALSQETKDLRRLLRVNETERLEQYKRFETNNRTLLKKVKEHMRGRKRAETRLLELDETYNLAISEINNMKLGNKRFEIEVKTLRFRCDEYKSICDNLNSEIAKLENEKISLNPPNKCLDCLDKDSIHTNYISLTDEKLCNYDRQIQNLNHEFGNLKNLLFNEKLRCSALQKQVSSTQMCLENANEQLDNKKIEFSGLQTLETKLKLSITNLEAQLDQTTKNYQECKRKLDETTRVLEDTSAKDEILADEIKTLSCHLHQKSLDISNLENKFLILDSKSVLQATNYENTIEDLRHNLSELQIELGAVRNDKFFLTRLCADLKMSLQGTVSQNKVLKHRLEVLENNSKNVSLENLAFLTKIDEEHINNLLRQSTISPDKPLKNLRSCLDSLKQEMVSLQKEIHIKTHTDLI